MAKRAQLSTGSYNKTDTLYAQKLLNEKGDYGLAVDGIYGKKTKAAVKAFQKANGLVVDGILGKNTWAALTKTVEKETKKETKKETTVADTYDASKNKTYQALLKQAKAAQQALADMENPLADYEDRLQALSQKQADRGSFTYDPAADPLYHQYKDQYTQQGSLAMLDAMGKAASLTGGYGSSYGQALGQQSYQSYLQKLGDVMPALYGNALDRYNAQTDAMASQYDQLLQQAELAYDDYQQQQKSGQSAVEDLFDRAAEAYKQGYNNWYDSYKNAAADKKTLYSSIVDLITKTGYIPPADQLKAAGMTKAVANAYANAYKR